MTKDDFNTWAADFTKRFPDTGNWIYSLPEETLDLWYQDIFKPFDLQDARAMNTKLMFDGIPTKWDRDGLPRLFIKTMQDIRHRRSERQTKARQPYLGAFKQVTKENAVCASVYRQVVDRMRDYRNEHDTNETPKEFVKQWVDELWP